MGKGQGHEKEGRGGVDEEVLLEACVVGHHHLSMKPLVKTEEDISGEAVSFPVTTSLDQERISTKTIKVCASSSPEGVATIAVGLETSSI